METRSSPQQEGPSTPSASTSTKEASSSSTALPAVAEVSPGEGAFSPPNDRSGGSSGGEAEEDEKGGDDDGSAVGFGPPPAFPGGGARALDRKRKRTLMAVSTPAGATSAAGGNGAPLEDDSSEEEEDNSGRARSRQSQMIHRIKAAPATTSEGAQDVPPMVSTPPAAADDGAEKKYSDAMLLASLSDVDSPKKPEDESGDDNFVDVTAAVEQDLREGRGQDRQAGSPKAASSTNSSNAPTPLRSNVNPNPVQLETVKPYALMPKPQGSFPNKRGKYDHHHHHTKEPVAPTGAAPHSPDMRDPKAGVRVKNEKREGAAQLYAPHPQHPGGSYPPPGSSYPPGSYPPGSYPGYPYSYSGGAVPPVPHPRSGGYPGGGYPGHPSYPPGYPYGSSYGSYAQGPPGTAAPSPYPYDPRAYYPGQQQQQQQQRPQAPGPAPSSVTPGRGSQGPGPDRWGTYHSPKHHDGRKHTGGTIPPEPVRSNAERPAVAAPYHPLSSSGRGAGGNTSHVVPSEDGDETAMSAEGAAYGRPPPVAPTYGAAATVPPPPGYAPDPRYGSVPGTDSAGYYNVPPYNAISTDEGTPPRQAPSPHRGGGDRPGAEYSPQARGTPPRAAQPTPPRGSQGYDYYEQGPPGSSQRHGSYHPPTPQSGRYHPDSPPRSSAQQAPPYSHNPYGPPPPSSGAHMDPYEPYDYAASSPPGGGAEAHYHVPNAVSNETECPPSSSHRHHHHHPGGRPGVPPSPDAGVGMGPKYHQFRKGGRSVHSEPIVLRKKFSWRNYPELEEYLIANRTDYLRHSALNYTAEQKHFNNRLTEGLLELAAKLNYVFDETCFNFVAVRDRIRCYYKSYVQSSKKRGVVVGFSKSQGHAEGVRGGYAKNEEGPVAL